MDLAEYVTGWAPQPVETTARIDAWPAAAFAGLLDVPSPVQGHGDPLPPMWHWFHLVDSPAQAELGDDGHPAQGRFLPPIPDRRRMFAGGRLRIVAPLRVDDVVTRRSELVGAVPKTGRSGAMVFVTVRHELRCAGEVALVEEQDFGYRSQPAGAQRTPAPSGSGAQPPDAAGQVRLDPDPALLFRFSALTYNAHRIHYDQPYATQVEGYPGLAVHGPLLALLLLELPRRFTPGRTVATFDYRLTRPAFAGTPIVASGDGDGGLVAGAVGAGPSVTGSVGFR